MARLLILGISLMFSSTIFAQNFELKSIEWGIKGGLSNYQGDLIKESISIRETNVALGVFARVFFHDNIAIGLNANTIRITGDDRNYTDPEDASRFNRGLKMENQLFEASVRAYYFPFMERSPVYGAWLSLQPYFGTGVSLVFNNPKLQDQNPADGIILGEKDSPLLSVPMVFGLKYVIKPYLSVSGETVFNVAFSDNLDGYTFSGSNDWFMFHSISISWHFLKTTAYNSVKEEKKTYFKKKRKHMY